MPRSSAGNTRGLIEARRGWPAGRRVRESSAGNTRGLIEAFSDLDIERQERACSAGNTRGLIEAIKPALVSERFWSLPRGIPAASLKLAGVDERLPLGRRLPRGIPAASLKR